MGLKQDIVVVNEYSIKTGSKGGSRGGTPGDYVLRYMARMGATEELTPVRLEDQDAYVTRYMARREATETYDTIGGVKKGMRFAQGLGGVAFGATGRDDIGDMSMSDRKSERCRRTSRSSSTKARPCSRRCCRSTRSICARWASSTPVSSCATVAISEGTSTR